MNGMKKRIGLLLAAAMLSFGSACAAEPVEVSLNESKYMAASGITRLAVGNPAIADVQLLSSGDFLLVGKKAGTTSLIVWSDGGRRTEYTVYVAGNDRGMASAIQDAIGYPKVHVQMMKDRVMLRGKVENQYEHDIALKIAGLYTGGDDSSVIDLLEMEHPSQIRLEAQIIEINSDYTKNLGIQYWSQTPGSNSSSDSSTGNSNSGITVGTAGLFYGGEDFSSTRKHGGWLGSHVANVNVTLQALINEGKARILSRPSITTMSGKTANILIGGRIPIPVSDGNGNVSIDWHEYGVKLNIEPVVDSEDKITSKVHAEVSTLDYSHGVKIDSFSVPGIATREAESEVNVRSGMTMAIGGLINSEDAKIVSKIPLLGDLPIIGRFFRHTSNTRDKREVIILITPTLVADDTPAPMSRRMKESYEAGERAARNRELVETGKPVPQGTDTEERDLWGEKPGDDDTIILEEKAPAKTRSYLLKTTDIHGEPILVPMTEEDYEAQKDRLTVARREKTKPEKKAKQETARPAVKIQQPTRTAADATAQRARIKAAMDRYSGKSTVLKNR
ncbi:MAG: pilus assembly protein N-terminal domain-containing protein [Dialister sp.]|nr:pilus assembly protein N-terminal domain-containing protein [Dialister sp.]MCI7054193.1 pilus assembly protein N-terminal domain-containing protein [Dialister sp.]